MRQPEMQHSAMDTHDDDVYTPPLFSKGEAFGLLIMFEFICIGMVILLSLGFMLLMGHKINTPAEKIMVQKLALIFSVLFMTYCVQKKREKTQTEETLASYLGLFGLDNIKWKFVLKWTLLFLLLHFVFGGINHLSEVNNQRIAQYQEIGILMPFISTVIVAPIAEEIWFRGILYPALYDSTNNPELAIAVTSIAFSFSHFEFTPLALIARALFGWLLLRARTIGGSLYVSIWLHALWNICAIAPAVFAFYQQG
jgi:membrane protein